MILAFSFRSSMFEEQIRFKSRIKSFKFFLWVSRPKKQKIGCLVTLWSLIASQGCFRKNFK